MTMRVNDAIMRQSQCLLSGQADVSRAMAAIQVRQTPPKPTRSPSPLALGVIFAIVIAVLVILCRAFAGRRKRVESFRGRPAALAAYLFLLPACLLLIVFRLLPAASAVWHSFTAWDGVGAPSYVGLSNYATLLRDDVFWRGTANNIAVMLTIPLWMLVSLLLALLIHQEVFGWRFFRAAFFAPAVLSPVIVGTLFCAFLGPDGPVNRTLGALGLNALALDWLGDPHAALPTLVMVILWGVFGHGVIVFLAGLAAVPRETFEAARLDGATGWRFLWHVVIPSLRHVIEFWGVNLVVWSFTSLFAFVYVMSQGGPGYATMLVSYQVYQEAFELESMGYACAVGTALLLMVFGLALLQIRLMAGDED